MSREIDWTRQKLWTAEMIVAERERLNEEHYGKWGRAIEVETRRRIRACVAAYAYEIANSPIMSDDAFDRLVQSINPRLGVCNPVIDEFFATHFSPMTGMWIHRHPDLAGIEKIYNRHHRRVDND